MGSGFRPEIEGLRGIAILLVVVCHAGFAGFDAGFIGVDVFFVLSGFLITGLLIDERERTGRIELGGFYARRAKRILPAAAVVLVARLFVAHLGRGNAVAQVDHRDAARHRLVQQAGNEAFGVGGKGKNERKQKNDDAWHGRFRLEKGPILA